MSSSVVLIALVIGGLCGGVVLAAAWLLHRRHRMPYPKAVREAPEVALEAVLADKKKDARYRNVDVRAWQALRESVTIIVNDIHKRRDPLLALRGEIMDSIDRRTWQHTALSVSESALNQRSSAVQSGLLAEDIRIEVLRAYGAHQFGDWADYDWYDMYWQVARLNQRSLQRVLGQEGEAVDDARYHSVVAVNKRLRQRLLAVTPGAALPRPKA